MGIKADINQIINKARKDALNRIAIESKKVLPDGWRVHFAVGWGFVVYDSNGKTVIGVIGNYAYNTKWPKGVKPFLNSCADFCDTFGYGNEIITSKGISY